MHLFASKSRSIVTKRLLGLALSIVGAGASQNASAEFVEAVPTTWRLQEYLGGNIDIYFAGTGCANGSLRLPAATPDASKNRLWALVSTGRAARLPVGIYYHVSGSECIIDNYYLKEGS